MERRHSNVLTETRKGIARFGRTLGSKTDKAVRGLAGAVSEKTTDILHSGKEVAGKAKKEIRTSFNKTQDKLRKQKEKLSRIIHH